MALLGSHRALLHHLELLLLLDELQLQLQLRPQTHRNTGVDAEVWRRQDRQAASTHLVLRHGRGGGLPGGWRRLLGPERVDLCDDTYDGG